MALIQKLKQFCNIKRDYRALQKRFYGEIFDRFPFIFKENMAEIANTLQNELIDMLCLSLKYRSIKIPLTATGRYYGADSSTIVNVQRGEPGFYYPQSQRGHSDIHYFNMDYYLDNQEDLWFKREVNNNNKIEIDNKVLVKLSELRLPKHAPRIHQDKIDVYFKMLKEVMAYRPKFLCYTDAVSAPASFVVDNMKFILGPQSFDIAMKSRKKKRADDDDDEEEFNEHRYGCHDFGFQYRPTNQDVIRLMDYSNPSELDFGEQVHERLNSFINNYDGIREKLVQEEAKKKLAVETCRGFIEQLRVHTIPFRVLGEITNK